MLDIIVLRSVNGKVGQKYFFNPCPDPKTGRYPDCVKRVDDKGNLILTDNERNSGKYFIGENAEIIVQDGTVFDLNNDISRVHWEAIKNSRLIVTDRYQKDANGNYLIDGTMGWKNKNPRYGIAELYIDRPGLETQIRTSKKKRVNNALNFIFNDSKDGQLIMAMLLGKHMEGMPASDVEDFLASIAEKDPDKIIKLYTGDDLSLRILFVKAREKGIIKNKGGVYSYSDSAILGSTEDAVITWMKDSKNKPTLELLRKDTLPEYEPINKKRIKESSETDLSEKSGK